MTNNQNNYDIAIIGAGSGGLVIAAVAAQLGYKVVLFEKHKMGGDCLNYGCVPTKATIAASKAMYNIKEAFKFGVFSTNPEMDFSRMKRHVKSVVDSIKPHDSVERFENLGVTVIQNEAKFINKTTVIANGNQYTAKKFVIATGSSPFIPPLQGLDKVLYLTNETIMELENCPKHLVIIGGGPIGCEFAQSYRRMGAEVTIIETNSSILIKDEPEITKTLVQQFNKEGIKILTSTNVEDVWNINGKIGVKINTNGEISEIKCSHILLATGRKANLNLDLEKAEVKYTNRNILVNKQMRTSNKNIFAIGDVAGPYHFTHMAGYQAGIVISIMLFGNVFAKVNYNQAPWCTYIDPELASVGLTESLAKEKYGEKHIKCVTLPCSSTDRAKAERKTKGSIKVVFGKSGKILGATMYGHLAGEIIQQWGILIANNMKARHLAKVICPYPTFSEINKQIISAYYKDTFYSERTGKVSRFLFKYLG